MTTFNEKEGAVDKGSVTANLRPQSSYGKDSR